MEEWRDVIGYEGLYRVSNKGRVYSIRRDKCLRPSESCRDGGLPGYALVQLRKDGKYRCHAVHRLVALAFIPNPQNLPIVNHRDGNKQNNTIDNLEWCTQTDNIIHALREGLHEKTREARKKVYESLKGGSEKI